MQLFIVLLEVQCCAPWRPHRHLWDHLWYQKVFKIIKATVWIAYFFAPNPFTTGTIKQQQNQSRNSHI
jgi:hypothetical protein